jgi:glucokinase
LLEAAWPSAEVLIINDVTAAGYGIATGPRDDFCVVTVSSGVGCKVFLDGRPIVGRSGRGGELGHLRIDPSSEANICECGGRGHLGGMASGRGALAIARRRMGAGGADLTCEQLVLAFHRDDAVATSVITEAAGALGTTFAALHTALGLERFVLTGGFAAALGDRFRHLVAQAAAAACWDLGQEWNDMVELHVSDDAGLVGAGRYAHRLPGADARAQLVRDAVTTSLETVAVGRFEA